MLDNENKTPLISVVIPCYKSEKYIARAIDSVLAQEKVKVQIIVVEDGVYDETSKIILSYGDKVEYVRLEKNKGACLARNIGLEKVLSEYVLFLDADDFIEGDLLIGLYNAINEKNASLAFAPCKKKWEGTQKETKFFPLKNETPLKIVERWLNGNSGPNPSSIMWKTSEIRRIGGWDTKLTINQDGELIIRAMFNGCTVATSYCGFGIYWQHDNESISKKVDRFRYFSQELLEQFVQNWLDKNNSISIKKALNVFRLRVALDAYHCGLIEIGNYWKNKWKNYGGFLPILPGKRMKIFIRNLLYILLGLRAGDYVISLLKKLINPKFKHEKNHILNNDIE